jgi:hypothetical protein
MTPESDKDAHTEEKRQHAFILDLSIEKFDHFHYIRLRHDHCA